MIFRVEQTEYKGFIKNEVARGEKSKHSHIFELAANFSGHPML